MAPEFKKIQAGSNNNLNNTTKVNKEETEVQNLQSNVQNGLSFKGVQETDMGTGAAGRSSVKMDNFKTDMITFNGHYDLAQMTNKLIDSLIEQGYSLENATYTVYNELGLNK